MAVNRIIALAWWIFKIYFCFFPLNQPEIIRQQLFLLEIVRNNAGVLIFVQNFKESDVSLQISRKKPKLGMIDYYI